MGLSDHTADSHNTILSEIILTLKIAEKYISWEGILTVKVHGRARILVETIFSIRNPWSTWWGWGEGGGAELTLTCYNKA